MNAVDVGSVDVVVVVPWVETASGVCGVVGVDGVVGLAFGLCGGDVLGLWCVVVVSLCQWSGDVRVHVGIVLVAVVL